MMKFLGSLGIDWRILLAQIVNFGLLLWVLTKFLYKPIIRRIEKDESELRQAQLLKKKLEQEQMILRQKTKNEIIKAKDRSREIMKEAEDLTKEIKRQAEKETEKSKKILLQQLKRHLQSQEEELKQNMKMVIEKEVVNRLQKRMKKIIVGPSQNIWQNILFDNLITQLKKTSIKRIKESEMADILTELSKKTTKERRGESGLEREFQELLPSKLGQIILEYVYPPTPEQENELARLLAKKIGVESKIIKIFKKKNEGLLNGFRLEVAGLIIESNLLNEIKNATTIR